MFGAWHFVHGHSGVVERPDYVLGLERKGWGLCFRQRAGTFNWVHFAIPTFALYNWRIDHVHVKFTAGEYARVSEVNLWDGNIKFWEQNLNYAGGEIDAMIELDREWEIFRALGVSLKVEADSAGDAHFMFHAVGANFRQ
ncbi:MAG TPA: DUF6623 family protein [Planctomycetota bacterium]|nr:DUF6623 family protein [Planctomycetota bacterium]